MMRMDYTSKAGFLIPNVAANEQPVEALGRYGRMRKSYLKQNRNSLYQGLLLSGRLTAHLLEIEQTANRRMETLTEAMMKTEGVTEALKAGNQMLWLGRMNSIQSRAEEIVLSELVYN